ncbi:MAG: hypothetical protein ACJ788_18350 [Ktedonobacteraceae bacterium]|jgi:hypothetical protein
MDARFYKSDSLNIERLATDLEQFFRSQGYVVQHIGNNDQMMVQLKKGSDFEAVLGMQAALTVTMQRNSGGITVAVGQQKWVDKAAVGVVGFAIPVLWPLLFTAGFGAFRQVNLANQVMTVVDGLVHQQQPTAQAGPAPAQQ